MTVETSKYDGVDLAQKLITDTEINTLSSEENTNVLASLSRLIGCYEMDSAWWWDKSAIRPLTVSYDQNGEQYSRVFNLLQEPEVIVIVTDDFAPPWLAFSGDLKRILELIDDSNYTEYVILSTTFEWAIFDNHHNALLIYGYLR